MADDVQAIRVLVSRYHQAITDRNVEVEHACFAGNRFRFAGNRSDDPTQWVAVGSFSEDEIRAWGKSLPEEVTYINHIEFLHTDVRNNLGLAVTRETGSTSWGGSWKNSVNVWFTAKIEGEWKIIGSFHRDDKL